MEILNSIQKHVSQSDNEPGGKKWRKALFELLISTLDSR